MIVYIVKNIKTGKVYIGQTSLTLDARKAKHESMRNLTGFYFHNALAYYGIDSFSWKQLCECATKEEMCEKEIYYIDKYKSNVKEFGYNLTPGGDTMLGYRHRESSKKKMSEAHKGQKNPHTEEWNKKIGDAQRGSKNHAWGKVGPKSPLAKKYLIIYPDGEEKTIKGLTHFCRQANLSTTYMCEVAKGKRKQYKGYRCFSLEEN